MEQRRMGQRRTAESRMDGERGGWMGQRRMDGAKEDGAEEDRRE